MGQGIELNYPGATGGNSSSGQRLRRQRCSAGSCGRLAAPPDHTLNAKSTSIAGGAVLTSYIFGKGHSVFMYRAFQPAAIWNRSTMVPFKYKLDSFHFYPSN